MKRRTAGVGGWHVISCDYNMCRAKKLKHKSSMGASFVVDAMSSAPLDIKVFHEKKTWTTRKCFGI